MGVDHQEAADGCAHSYRGEHMACLGCWLLPTVAGLCNMLPHL
jgi:hypothetical protein